MFWKLAVPTALVAATAIAIPALTQAQSGGGTELVVREKVASLRFVHQQRSTRGDRLLTGDRVLTRQRLFDESDKRIGTLYTDCVNVGGPARVFKATLLCSASYRFAGGQFATVGSIRLADAPGTSPTPILGSGKFRGQRGEVASTKSVKGYDSADVLRIDP